MNHTIATNKGIFLVFFMILVIKEK